MIKLLTEYHITDYEVEPYIGWSLRYGKLKRLIVYDRFIHIADEFEKLGYGVTNRRRE